MNTPLARIGDFNLKPPPENRCQICGNEHEPAHPHNPDSFYYRVCFINQHGRPPTWRDAMKHCPPHEKEAWSWALARLDIDLDSPILGPREHRNGHTSNTQPSCRQARPGSLGQPGQ